MRSRCAYALRAAGTWEVRPASRVERIVSTYTGITSGTPSPPSSVGVRTRSVVLHSEPRALMPSECCTHRAARQRASVKTSQIGTPPWTGKMRRRHSVLPMTSLSCEKEGESPAHVLKNDFIVPCSLETCVVHLPCAPPRGPQNENQTPRYLAASSGGTEVMCCSARVPSESRATKLIDTRPRLPASTRTASGDRTR